MPLLPTRQLQFHTSPNFNSLRFFTHTSSSIHKNFIFNTPIINFTYFPFKKPFFHCNTFCTHTWLKRWNQPSSKHTRPKPPRAVLDISSSDDEAIGGSRMDRIVEKLKKFGYENDEVDDRPEEGGIEKGSVEDIFHVEEGMLPNTRGGFSPESPFGVGRFGSGGGEVRFPWEKPVVDEEVQERKGLRKKSKTSMAELTLPESELRRLLKLSFMKKHKTRIGGGGVTQAVVEKIHERWKTSEIVRLKFEGDAALNMKRMHEMLERKTGGLVIWRSGNSVSLYRGVSYKDPSIQHNKQLYRKSENPSKFLPTPSNKSAVRPSEFTSNSETNTSLEKLESTSNQKEKVTLPKVSYEDEVDKLLNDLGPRYTDWAGCEPLPVDADMLPPTVPGYQPPFRVLPFGVRPTLGLKEATSLRRIARGLPPHFALGRNRQLQGLAAAMIKLWEKSSIAKVALKRGVQLTTSERMAEEIKKLTGGIILSRNKDFLVFYRGKNFLSPDVTQALQERERMAKAMQDEEEHARLRASSLILPAIHKSELSAEAGTLGETLDADAKWGKTLDEHHEQKVIREVEQLRHANLVRKLEEKLSLAERKIMRAEKALMKVEVSLKPSENRADPESITDEERFMFRKLGLRMKAFLLMGRRGVFDGTIENMHLHWKYRELVKIIAKASNFEQVKKIALALEAESGGVLVSVDKVSKGYSILVYRGKDYKRPSMLRPKNLLTKRKALARSIELQRHEALSSHILTLQSKVEKLRSEIEQIEKVKDEGDEALYNKLDSAYSTDDDSSEAEDDEEGDEALYNKLDSACSTDDHSSEAEDDEEGDETYLESYNNENEGEFENDTINFQPEEFASRS